MTQVQPSMRAVQDAAKFAREKQWMEAPYERPCGIPGSNCLDDLSAFQRLIWNMPKDMMLEDYGHTPDELAALCAEGTDGWLLSSHISWIFDRLNESQTQCMNICSSVTSIGEFKRLKERMGNEVERFNFVLNVGKNSDGSVFIGSWKRSGNHWVLVSVDNTSEPTVLYCDSLGWDRPADLVDHITSFTREFGIANLPHERIIMMHQPTPGSTHQCNAQCKSYPLQTCSNV